VTDTVAIGVDVGATNVRLGLVTPRGELLASESLQVRSAESAESLLAIIVDRVKEAEKAKGERRTAGVGIGMPELVDLAGQIRTHCSFPWTTAQLQDALGSFGPVFVMPDVRAAAIAEERYGAGRGSESFLYLSIGTGISHTLVLHGRALAGARGAAQLVGSATITHLCSHCDAQHTGPALEDYASGSGVAKLFNERTGRHEAGAEAVFEAAEDGNAVARDLITRSAEAVGSWGGLLVNILDPHSVVLGGGLGLAGGSYARTLVEAFRRAIWAPYVRSIPIHPARLGVLAGVVGAALTPMSQS
jgi:glucokinase